MKDNKILNGKTISINDQTNKSKLIENKLWIFKYTSICVQIFTVFCIIKRYVFAVMAENYYGVPIYYFYNDFKVATFFYLLILAISCSVMMMPLFLKISATKHKYYISVKDALLYSILVMLSLFILLSTLFTTYFYQFLYKKCYILSLEFIIFYVPLAISVGGFVITFLYLLKVVNSIQNQKNKATKISVKWSIETLYALALVIINIIIIILIFNVIYVTPEMIKKYEIVKLEDGTTKMIITHRGDKAILMDYISLNQDGNLDESGNNIIIDKGHYSLESIDGKPIEFKKFASVSNDNYESYKKENKTVK